MWISVVCGNYDTIRQQQVLNFFFSWQLMEVVEEKERERIRKRESQKLKHFLGLEIDLEGNK